MIRKLSTFAVLAMLALAPSSLSAQTAERTIVETAVAAGTFTTLAAALEAADLLDVLQGDGPFTVFAPTDAAFAKLPSGTVEALLADKEALIRVLTYHVVAGKVMASDVVGLSTAETVAGVNAPIEVRMGKVYVAGAQVSVTDVAASNRVIRIIDSVMLPPHR